MYDLQVPIRLPQDNLDLRTFQVRLDRLSGAPMPGVSDKQKLVKSLSGENTRLIKGTIAGEVPSRGIGGGSSRRKGWGRASIYGGLLKCTLHFHADAEPRPL